MPSADVTALLTGIEDLAGSLRDGMAHVSSMENAGAVAARVLDKSYREQALLEIRIDSADHRKQSHHILLFAHLHTKIGDCRTLPRLMECHP